MPVTGSKVRWYVVSSAGTVIAQCYEAQARGTAGDASSDLCSGGTASASSEFSGSLDAANAFDNDDNTRWVADTPFDEWIEYDFGSDQTIAEMYIDAQYTEATFRCEVWDGSEWVVQGTVSKTGTSREQLTLLTNTSGSGADGSGSATAPAATASGSGSVRVNSLPAGAAGVGPEEGLTLTGTYPAGSMSGTPFGAAASRKQPTVIAFEAYFPATMTNSAALFECGGGGRGWFVGTRDSGTIFRVRGGDGQSIATDASRNGAACLDLPMSDLPSDDAVHTVVVEMDPRPASPGLRLWVDGELLGSATPPNGVFENDEYAGTGSGMFYSGSGSNVSGETNNQWAVINGSTGASDLRYYTNQTSGFTEGEARSAGATAPAASAAGIGAVGPFAINGTGSAVAPSATASGAGSTLTKGAGSAAAPVTTSSGEGSTLTEATGGATAPSVLASGTGRVLLAGQGEATAPAALVAGSAVTRTSGSGGAAAPAPTASGVGSVASTVTGSGSATAPSAEATGTGYVLTAGSGAAEAPSATAQGQGAVSSTGQGTTTAPSSEASGVGFVLASGSGSTVAPAPTASGVGSVAGAVVGSGSAIGPSATAAGAGSVLTAGSGSAIGPAATATGAGSIEGVVAGSGSATVPAPTASGTGFVVARGDGAATASGAQGDGAGAVLASGQGAATVSRVTATGTALVLVKGSGSATAPSPTTSGEGNAGSSAEARFYASAVWASASAETVFRFGFQSSQQWTSEFKGAGRFDEFNAESEYRGAFSAARKWRT